MIARLAGLVMGGGGAIGAYIIIALLAALGLTITGASIAVWYLDGKVESAQARERKTASEVGMLRTEREQHKAAAAACSASVAALGDRQKGRDAKVDAALSAAAVASASMQKGVQAILSAQRPAGMSECDAMKKELDDEIRARTAGR